MYKYYIMYKGDRDLPLPPIRLYCLNHFLRILDKTKRLSVIIPTRSAKPRLKQFCIRGLAWAIGIIQIIQEL